MKKIIFFLSALLPLFAVAQQQETERDLGNKEYVIVKDYKPVLAESSKISDMPEGDTSTVDALPQNYAFESRKAETLYETSAIKAVKIKDEPLPKLYRAYLKAGGGNYDKYLGELYVNSLRSKKGSLGLTAKHLSGAPSFEDYNFAGYSNNLARVDGSYFLDHATFSADVTYKRDVVHYYGYDKSDTALSLQDEDILQRFSDFGGSFAFQSNVLDSSKWNYKSAIRFSALTDNYGAKENEIIVGGGVFKRFNETLVGMDIALDFFSKKKADFEQLSLYTDLDRNILRFNPYVGFNRDRIRFKAGIGIEAETNYDAALHVFPRLDVQLPVADGVLSLFAKVDGQVEKNNYHTVTAENPFVSPSVTMTTNTIRTFDVRGGANGTFSDAFSYTVYAAYQKFTDLQYFVMDSSRVNNFILLYDDASRIHVHGELMYRTSEKLGIALHVDQFSYNTDVQQYAWYRPSTVLTLKADYNLKDKILVKAALFGVGERYALKYVADGSPEVSRLKPYLDANLGIEYRYSKILSAFVNFNNLGFSGYQQWYGYPMEQLNIMGGITYSF
jgi:hypothetical protein